MQSGSMRHMHEMRVADVETLLSILINDKVAGYWHK